MSKNTLTRNENSQGSFVYRSTQYEGTSFTSQRFANVRIDSSVNNITRPFGAKTGQWRVLNLKVDPNQYGGDEGASLSFSFSRSGNETISAACGFVLGNPPLHATHVNTVTRSIAYGFILNPFEGGQNSANDKLFIVHQNKLFSVINGSVLKINIKGNKIQYSVQGQVVAEETISDLSMVLHVVSCLGFAGNQINNVSLTGGSSIILSPPDFSKELLIPCLGLTSEITNSLSLQDPIGESKQTGRGQSQNTQVQIQLKHQTGLNNSCTIYYPDGTEQAISSTVNESWVSTNKSILSFTPFALKIVFSNGLSTIKGLRIVNPLISSELSLDRSLQYLTNLEYIEVRSTLSPNPTAEGAILPFYPTIGTNLPLPASSNSQLKLAGIEATYEVRKHDLSYQQNLTNLFLATPLEQSTFPDLSAARNLTYFEAQTSVQDWSLQNFRNVFVGDRNTHSYGVRLISNIGQQISLSSANSSGLAIAQQSYMLMYAKTGIPQDNTNYFSIPQGGNGFAGNASFNTFTSQKTENGVTYSLGNIRQYIFEGIKNEGDEQKITFFVYSSSMTTPSVNQLFCIRTSGHANANTLNHQLRRIKNVQTERVNIPFILKATNGTSLTTTKDEPFVKCTIVTQRTEEHQNITGLEITSNNLEQVNTLKITSSIDAFGDIKVGDSLWDLGNDGTATPLAQTDETYRPAIVIRKLDDKNLIVLQSTGGTTSSLIGTGNNKQIMFRWEFSLLEDEILNPSQYPTDMRNAEQQQTSDSNLVDMQITFTTSNLGTSTDVFTDERVSREFLVRA